MNLATQEIHGACPHDCPDACGIVTVVKESRAVDFFGDLDHPITQGWLCAKVRPYLDHVYHPDRLKFPLKRNGPKGSGRWQRISWDDALNEIGDRWQDIINQHGAEAILPYSYSGTLGLVQMVVSSGRFWNRLGASQLQRSICGAAAEHAVEATLGARLGASYKEVLNSKLVICWGHNPVSTAPHFMPYLRQAQRSGTQLVVIDPRRTRTAKGADWHLQPLPGTDGALALGVANVICSQGEQDEAWLAEYTVGWPQLRERLADYPPERAAAITGLTTEDVLRLAELYISLRPGLIKICDGINRNFNGGQAVRAVCALPALTGQYGVAGGGLAYSASGYVKWDDQSINKWHECPAPGRTVNMNRLGAALLGEVADPPIKSLFVFGANPVTSSPNAVSIIKGLQRSDLFTVVHELFMTDTADYADIVLPATSQLEQTDLHKAYGNPVLTYNRPAISPLGESKSNWEVMGLLAQAMEYDEPWLYQDVDSVIDEVVEATARQNSMLGGVTLERFKTETTIALNLDSEIPFADGRFSTPSRKVELFSQKLAEEGIDPLPSWKQTSIEDGFHDGGQLEFDPAHALQLVSGAAHHFVSSSFANQKGLLSREGSPFVEINPIDASQRGILHGAEVVLENGRGWITLKAKVTEDVRPGVVASPKGRWQKLGDGRNINFVTSDLLADMAGQSTFHSTFVWLRSFS